MNMTLGIPEVRTSERNDLIQKLTTLLEQEMHQTESRPAIDSTDPVDLLNHDLEFFWAMSLIVAKYIAHGDVETVGHMMGLIERTLGRIVGSLGPGWSNSCLLGGGKSGCSISVTAFCVDAGAITSRCCTRSWGCGSV